MDEHKALQSDVPISCLANSPGQTNDACIDIASRVRGEMNDLLDISVIKKLIMACRIDKGDIKFGCFTATHFGNADAGLVLYCAQSLSKLARRHCLHKKRVHFSDQTQHHPRNN